jgi:3D (Asp-Asp-Asp) domain-containing protein
VRWKRPLLSVLGIAAFCGYLISTCSPPATPASSADRSPSALLLARTTYVPDATPAEVASSAPAQATTEEPEPEAAPARAPAVEERPQYKEVWAVVTAYCPCRRCCGRFANGKTSTGTSAWVRGIAADPTVLPYGTRVEVEGYGTSKIDDTGLAMRRTWRRSGMIHLDVRMTYHYEARNWGRKIMKIRIYEPEK